MSSESASGATPLIPKITVGVRMKLARETAGVDQQVLATELGVSRSTLVRWEHDKGLKKSAILLYAMRTGVPAEWIESGEYTPRDLNPEPTD